MTRDENKISCKWVNIQKYNWSNNYDCWVFSPIIIVILPNCDFKKNSGWPIHSFQKNINITKYHLYLNLIYMHIIVTTLIVPPAGLPNQGLRKITQYRTLAFYQEERPQRFCSCKVPEATVGVWILVLWTEYVLFVSLIVCAGWG